MQAKKLTLALHLDPAASQADVVALDVLQQWYAQTKQSFGEGAAMDGAVRQFHHDVYLTGLQLHLLGANLCQRVASGLAKRETSAEVLIQHLQASGLQPQPSQPTDAGEAVFSAAQLEQLANLVADAPATANTDDSEDVASASFAEQTATLESILNELQQLRALAEQQAAELHQLRLGNPAAATPEKPSTPAAEELNVSEMAPQLAQMQKIREKGVF